LLVAEDSPTQAVAIRRFLERDGYAVEIAKDGREGLEKVRANQPDLVVTDLEMPEMNGLELVEALHGEFPRLPVVLITSRGSEEIAAAALRKGAASYVPKALLEQDLAPTLEQILAVSEALRTQDRLKSFLMRTATEYLLENDTALVPSLVARLQNELCQLDLCDEAASIHVAMALDEALTNAIIHGNLEVSSQLRETDDGDAYVELIRQRRSEPPYSERRVAVTMNASREKASFVIRDEGPGFDLASLPDPTDPENLDRPCGRGLLLINTFMDAVTHNERGNEITMVKTRPQ
jgi:CheY-like chemotaxis protein